MIETKPLSEETLLAVCGTREGALLRFMRLTERLWGQAGNHEKEEIRNGMMDLIKNLDLPEKEKGFICSELDNNYAWLDKVYEETRV